MDGPPGQRRQANQVSERRRSAVRALHLGRFSDVCEQRHNSAAAAMAVLSRGPPSDGRFVFAGALRRDPVAHEKLLPL